MIRPLKYRDEWFILKYRKTNSSKKTNHDTNLRHFAKTDDILPEKPPTVRFQLINSAPYIGT